MAKQEKASKNLVQNERNTHKVNEHLNGELSAEVVFWREALSAKGPPDPTYYTVAEFINTIFAKGIQVEPVTGEDWWIEDVRVAILNRLKNDISKGVPIVEGKGNEVVETEEATEEVQPKKVTSKTDLQRWGEQGSAGWSKREDGTDLNEEEVNEEYARWDATVKEARDKRKAEKATTLLGENVDPNEGFWEFGDRPMRLQSLDLGDESDSLAEQIKTIGLAADDSEVTASNNAKTLETVSKTDASQKPEESMCEQKKRKAPEIRHTVKDGDEAGAYGELFLKAITAQDILSQESGSYTSSVYSEHDGIGGHGKAMSKSTHLGIPTPSSRVTFWT